MSYNPSMPVRHVQSKQNQRLKELPSLDGRVSVKWVIDDTGRTVARASSTYLFTERG